MTTPTVLGSYDEWLLARLNERGQMDSDLVTRRERGCLRQLARKGYATCTPMGNWLRYKPSGKQVSA